MGAIHDLFDRYGDRVRFFVVYIKEAHPEDGWVLTPNRADGIAFSDPTTVEERTEVAQTCAVRMAIRLPVVVDDVDNRVASAFGGWPDRLYLIGRGGRIVFQGEAGPEGFRPDELGAAIESELARPASG